MIPEYLRESDFVEQLERGLSDVWIAKPEPPQRF
jgi:hypothetical protein